jgi:DNA-binding NarL/FixJ family response regulator
VAYARWRQAEALLVAGTDDDAVAGVSVLRAAARAAEAAGAALIRREVVALARRTRVPLHPSTPAPSSPPPASPGLTPRELEILQKLAEGYTNRQIATLLFVSPKTVGVHVERIFRKLDVHDRVAAATKAHRLGLVD